MGKAVDVGRLSVDDVEGLAERLLEFMKPYRDRIGWISRAPHLDAFVAGLVGSSERKSVEPIAHAQRVDRRQLQHFVGVSVWDHLPLLGRVCFHIGALSEPKGGLFGLTAEFTHADYMAPI